MLMHNYAKTAAVVMASVCQQNDKSIFHLLHSKTEKRGKTKDSCD